ncbi:MAG TPA: hypothetical protein PLZ08_03605 [Bacillota bacterium]|nr:hypothetical protein [Bacillota bacterium]HOL09202.1 hypothetical protein [Bacillota bacterium]HPO97026.1 hypothetical protein [Bacillota bacterium]
MNTKVMIVLFIIACSLSLFSAVSAWAESVSNQTTTADRLQMQEDISEILKDPKFNYPDHFQWLKTIWSKITAFINRYKSKFPKIKLHQDDRIIYKLAIGLVIILPIVIICFLIRLWSKEKTASTTKLTEVQQFHNSYQKMIAQANEFQSSGLYLESVRLYYLAVLLYLKEQNLIPKIMQTSDNETKKYLRKTVGAEHQIFKNFCKLLYLFQEKWYGLKNCILADSIQASELTEQIIGCKDVNLNKFTGDIHE